jgi:hypothetical protein
MKRCTSLLVMVDVPPIEPSLTVERAWVAIHVRREANFPIAEGECAPANAVYVRNEREAACVENVFASGVAFPQYRPHAAAAEPFKGRNTPAD